MPHALTDQEVLYDLVGLRVDYGDAICRSERDECQFSVARDVNTNRLDGIGAHARNRKFDFMFDRMFDRIDHADSTANFRGYPELRTVGRKRRKTGSLTDKDTGHNLLLLRVDKVGHIRGLGRIDENFAVWTHDHAFRLHANLYRSNLRPPSDVDDRHRVVVLIGDIEQLAIRALGEKLRIWPRGQRTNDGIAGGIDHLNGVIVAARDENIFLVLGIGDATRPLTNFNCFRHLPGICVDLGDGVAPFI